MHIICGSVFSPENKVAHGRFTPGFLLTVSIFVGKMTVLLVGADQLGNLPKEPEKHGCKELIHWSGRKKMTRKKDIPVCVDKVLVLHDFVNHNLSFFQAGHR